VIINRTDERREPHLLPSSADGGDADGGEPDTTGAPDESGAPRPS
jgi:hypothetical protein